MTEQEWKLRNSIDETIQCEEISYKGKWLTYGELVDILNYYVNECNDLEKYHDTVLKCLDTTEQKLKEENKELKLRLEFFEAHNKALIHTNKELHQNIREYNKLLETEYFKE